MASSSSSSSLENEVLKLVYPGGLVETYKNPITAAQVMKRNPRHCVTRPDVFKFPWIVVRPESVLKPGRVFYIVPYHTIHRLLRSKMYHDQGERDFSSGSQRPKVTERNQLLYHHHHHHHHHHHCRQLPGSEDNEADDSPGHSSEYKRSTVNKSYTNYRSGSGSQWGEAESPVKRSQEEQWSTYSGLYGNDQEPEQRLGHLLHNHAADEEEGSMPRLGLKSCLKKHNNSIAKSRGFRVRFSLDDYDDQSVVNSAGQSALMQLSSEVSK